RIASKSLVGATYIQDPYASTFIPFHYDNHYHYNNTSQPNTLSHIDNGPYQYFEWDTKGNMVLHHNDQTGFDRRLCWDEENRLQGVLDNQYLSLYQYDANGERTYKLAGWNALQNRNGNWRNYYLLDHATLYASPYLVATPQGYTKHYYVENERIASKIGGGELNSLTLNIVGDPDFFEKIAKNRTHAQRVAQDCLLAGEIGTQSVMWPLFEWKNCIEAVEKDCYWYHTDHLGSSSWITYSDGKAVQHLQYLPWGENFVDQQSTYWNARYTFSAKEKDTETGYSYFGSRYYSSDLSIWLSVDPMSDKYPSLSPYTYCANNPIRLMDPNGEEVVNEYAEAKNKAENDYSNAKSKFDSYGKNRKAEGYKEARQEYRSSKREYNSIKNSYNMVQSAIKSVKKYNTSLYESLDNLQDENGNTVDVYVGINTNMSLRGKYNDCFNGENFVSKHGINSIQIELNPGFLNCENLGEILSHEGGHALYAVRNNTSYSQWLQNNVPDLSKHNGHDYDDPSGKEAYRQQGIYNVNRYLKRGGYSFSTDYRLFTTFFTDSFPMPKYCKQITYDSNGVLEYSSFRYYFRGVEYDFQSVYSSYMRDKPIVFSLMIYRCDDRQCVAEYFAKRSCLRKQNYHIKKAVPYARRLFRIYKRKKLYVE
ncbi:MAG: hypothetical protein J5644_10625, partial [Bacteroidales bacterium]|nr:hypothetical protein [Bacteroidales bacterium]